MSEKKTLNVIFTLFSGLCLVAIFVCLICDFAVNKNVSWSLYVLLSVPFCWAVLTPMLLMKKNKVLSTLAVVSVLSVLYLFLLGKITPAKDWFGELGLPSAVIAILSMWATYVVFKHLKLNKWLKSSFVVFLLGAISTPLIELFVSRFLDIKFFTFDNIFSFAAMLALSCLLFYIGRGHHLSNNAGEPLKSVEEKKADE